MELAVLTAAVVEQMAVQAAAVHHLQARVQVVQALQDKVMQVVLDKALTTTDAAVVAVLAQLFIRVRARLLVLMVVVVQV